MQQTKSKYCYCNLSKKKRRYKEIYVYSHAYQIVSNYWRGFNVEKCSLVLFKTGKLWHPMDAPIIYLLTSLPKSLLLYDYM